MANNSEEEFKKTFVSINIESLKEAFEILKAGEHPRVEFKNDFQMMAVDAAIESSSACHKARILIQDMLVQPF